jgi:DNA (cytosine-5)-methyltransferase 1
MGGSLESIINNSARPIAVDLFAGAGGFALGFEQAGFDVVAAVEYDPVHAAVHSYNFPHTAVLCADIARLSVAEVLAAANDGCRAFNRSEVAGGDIDVVFGGPPCQGFSSIGKRLVDDSRNQLVFHFYRLVTELRPRYFVMENVPGMAQGAHSSILSQLIREFEEAGYVIKRPPRVLHAADYGVPQSRRRLFLLGSRAGEGELSYPSPTTVRKKSTPNGSLELVNDSGVSAHTPTVGEAIGDLPDLDEFEELLDSDEVELSKSAVIAWESRLSEYAKRLRNGACDPTDLSYPRSWNGGVLTSSRRTLHTDLSKQRFGSTPPGQTEPVSRFLRLDLNGLANTLRAGTGGERGAYTSPRPIHPTLDRVISVREAARLHSFPDWFRLHRTKWHGFRQVGNAVPPLLGRAVARQVVTALGRSLQRPSTIIKMGDPDLLTLAMTQAAADIGAESVQMPGSRTRNGGSPMRGGLSEDSGGSEGRPRYEQLMERIFGERFSVGASEVQFSRDDIVDAAAALGIALPKNLGDVIYSFRYRVELPQSIRSMAPEGLQWVIRPAGRGRYKFVVAEPTSVIIRPNLSYAETRVPDATPGIVAMYALSDEQSLLAVLRYNRLIDIFTGIACYSLQSHLRTTVPGMGQVETDEVYVGVDKRGIHYVIPVQAKGKRDTINVVQIEQDFAIGETKFPGAICRPVAAQFMPDGAVALFAFEKSEAGVKVYSERHYRLVDPEQLSVADREQYANRADGT